MKHRRNLHARGATKVPEKRNNEREQRLEPICYTRWRTEATAGRGDRRCSRSFIAVGGCADAFERLPPW